MRIIKNFIFAILLLQITALSGCGNDSLKELTMEYIVPTSQLKNGKIDTKQYITAINNIQLKGVPDTVANNFFSLKNVAINASQHVHKSLLDHGITIATSIVKGYLGDITAVTDPLLEGYNTFSLSKEWTAAEFRFFDSLLAAGIDKKWLTNTLVKYGLLKLKNK